MAFPSKRPSELVVELGIGKKRGGPPPMWKDEPAPAPYGAAPEAEEPTESCAKCCKQASGCKFYEPDEAPAPEPEMDDLGGEAA